MGVSQHETGINRYPFLFILDSYTSQTQVIENLAERLNAFFELRYGVIGHIAPYYRVTLYAREFQNSHGKHSRAPLIPPPHSGVRL